jgi:hypothetical protein
VLRARELYKSIHSTKPSPASLGWITRLCGEHGAEKVIESIDILAKKGWHSIDMLQKVISGELPKPATGGIVIMEDPQKGKV